MEVSSFEIMEVTFNLYLWTFRLTIVHRPGHPGTDRAFMEEFAMLLESLLLGHEKPLIICAITYWLDDPPSKLHTHKFMRLIHVNNIINLVPVFVSVVTLSILC